LEDISIVTEASPERIVCVITGPAVEHVVASVACQSVCAASAIQRIPLAATGELVGDVGAGSGDHVGYVRCPRHVLDIRHVSGDESNLTCRGFGKINGHGGHGRIGVLQRVRASAAVERAENIRCSFQDKDVVSRAAGDVGDAFDRKPVGQLGHTRGDHRYCAGVCQNQPIAAEIERESGSRRTLLHLRRDGHPATLDDDLREPCGRKGLLVCACSVLERHILRREPDSQRLFQVLDRERAVV